MTKQLSDPVFPDLHGKVVLITGGANGIGESMVRLFHRQGAIVHFCDLDAVAGNRLVKELGNGVSFSSVDLRNERQIQRWVDNLQEGGGGIDVLVNNAACDPRIPLQETTIQAWDDLFARNLRAFFLTAKSVSPRMRPGSSIINFSSITFHIAPAEMTAYVSTKAGIIGFTRSLARELGRLGIRVNTISPGWIMTPRQKKQFVTAEIRRMLRKAQCIPDLIQPEEIARIALFLASESSSAITGQELLADRGWQHS